MPVEGTNYQYSTFVEEFNDYLTAALNYDESSLEPIADLLYATACNEASFSHIDGITSTIPTVPFEVGRDISLAGQDISFQPLLSSQSNSRDSSSSPVYHEPYVYSLTSETQFEDTNMHGSPIGNMVPSDSSSVALSDLGIQNWIDSSYTPGKRVYPIPTSPASWFEMPLHPQNQLSPAMQPGLIQIVQTQSLEPVPGEEMMRSQNDSRSDRGGLICGHNGCSHTSYTKEGLRHHRRYHLPMEFRPHRCPHCHQRFLCPREVERHLSTHGLGRRFYCNVPFCQYATKGFGRRDHLTRHVRRKHAADSLLQTTETCSSVESTTSASGST